MLKRIAFILAPVLALTIHAHAQWPGYSIYRIGLYDAPHTGSAGLQSTTVQFLSPNGVIAGYSNTFVGASTVIGQDAWGWNGGSTVLLGLLGPDHTGASGQRNSANLFQSGSGIVVGNSQRFTPSGVGNGQDSWLWNGSTVTQVGFVGGMYTGSAGWQESVITAVNSAGQVTGYSTRVSGLNGSNGLDGWFWNGSSLLQLGFTDPQHTGSSGYRSSITRGVNDSGQVYGTSQRISGVSTISGLDTWVWNGSTTILIGLTGPNNTNASGGQSNSPMFQSPVGRVVGGSGRYAVGGSANGIDAWGWDGNGTSQIGLTGGAFTGSAGYESTTLQLMNAAGQTVGISNRILNTNTANGTSAWVWNGTSTLQIGLNDSVHTGSAGYQSTFIRFQNDSGQVCGYSQRLLDTNTNNGYDSWVWTGAATVQIGLTGGEYNLEGLQQSVIRAQNAAGHVAGYSNRYRNIGGTDNGQDTWVWRNGATQLIGLNGTTYTDSLGHRVNDVIGLNDAGVVVGFVQHGLLGLDAWYFDPSSGTTYPVIISVRASDGYAFSMPTLVTQDGFLLGYYQYYGDNSGATRAFMYRPDRGVTDLTGLVVGGIASAGWGALGEVTLARTSQAMVGRGIFNGPTTSNSSYVMVPAPCRADFNHSGMVEVQDIFDFLGAWFAAAPAADFNGINGITVADIFDFLAAWFAGCP